MTDTASQSTHFTCSILASFSKAVGTSQPWWVRKINGLPCRERGKVEAIRGRSSVRGWDSSEGGSVIVERVWEWAGSASLARHTPTIRGATSSPIFHL